MTFADHAGQDSAQRPKTRAGSESLAALPRPRVALSWAQSLDGCIAASKESRLRISGEESMRMTHRMRSEHDAILVGIGTVIADNPKLTVRLVEGRSPIPLVVDATLRIPRDCSLMRRSDCKPWIFTTSLAALERRTVLESLGARIFMVDGGAEGQVDLEKVLDILGVEGIKNLMVEGGGRILASFLRLRLADSVTVTIGPMILGGYNPFTAVEQPGVPAAGLPRVAVPESLLRLTDLKTRMYGQDIVVSGIPVR